ncbi:hypothetical protein LRP30_05850 [Bradyrhizobium sp. C-145]|uniref:hypothetical protein n=1 Tax=Bradyrhizobium sp. C-145 TaxID=574727 RepID=UPI00201B6CED|nr:hypothetical protein [Bradyrhizobium sp. C-145]UQR64827.1 hypothetical protein LRP30_05850 [Bradyrhizobium sp. C-145]
MKVVTVPGRLAIVGKRLVSVEQIAFVEPFDPAANPEFKPEKDFRGRIVLLDRDTVLTEQVPEAFASEHELHLFTEDNVAVSRSIVFRVETFEPTENFNPTKPYKTRLKWRDLAGANQSKLLVTPPETVIAELLQAKAELVRTPKRPTKSPDEVATARAAWKRFRVRFALLKRRKAPAGAQPAGAFCTIDQ